MPDQSNLISQAPGLENGGLNELLALYQIWEAEVIKKLRITQEDAEVIVQVRQLQGAARFVNYVQSEVKK